MGKPQPWSYTAGRHGHRVRVFERRGRKSLYASMWDPTARGGQGAEVKVSLGHAHRQKAQDYADELAGKLRRGEAEVRAADQAQREGATVSRIFGLYMKHRSPDKGLSARRADQRHAAAWTRFLGESFDLSTLSRREWDRFVRDRRSGAISARGEPVKAENRKPVRARPVQMDCTWLRTVCRWAMEFRDGGAFLLDRDPTRGLSIPREKNPTRPVASHDRVDAIRAVYREPRMQAAGKLVESYLPEIFELTVGTGRRVSAVCALRFEDLDLERSEAAPWGAIVWPGDTDKMGKRWRCPISTRVREALEAAIRKRGWVGSGPLFPHPSDRTQSVGYYEAATWLRAAEAKAGLPTQEGSLWHAYRRLWASSRKGLPDVDVAQAGGWSSLDALKQAYQQPDDATMLRVVTHEAELREGQG